MDFVNYYESPLGKITLSSDGTKLTGLCFFDQYNYAGTMDSPHSEKELPVFTLTKSWLAIYFAGRCPNFSPEITFKGTAFQERVWNELQKIPYGQTTTYGEIAKRLAAEQGQRHMSAQAVGRAVGHNPIAIIIPCHRVIGSGGKLTGYSGGLERKEKLLLLERVDSLQTGTM